MSIVTEPVTCCTVMEGVNARISRSAPPKSSAMNSVSGVIGNVMMNYRRSCEICVSSGGASAFPSPRLSLASLGQSAFHVKAARLHPANSPRYLIRIGENMTKGDLEQSGQPDRSG